MDKFRDTVNCLKLLNWNEKQLRCRKIIKLYKLENSKDKASESVITLNDVVQIMFVINYVKIHVPC